MNQTTNIELSQTLSQTLRLTDSLSDSQTLSQTHRLSLRLSDSLSDSQTLSQTLILAHRDVVHYIPNQPEQHGLGPPRWTILSLGSEGIRGYLPRQPRIQDDEEYGVG
jgi:hypothetical protein